MGSLLRMLFRSHPTETTMRIIKPHTVRALPALPQPLLSSLSLRDTNHIRKSFRLILGPPSFLWQVSLCITVIRVWQMTAVIRSSRRA